MHEYRTNTCGELDEKFEGRAVRLAGWIASKRDHGGMMFIDLRDHYGTTQCVIDMTHPDFPKFEKLRIESVVSCEGEVVLRSPDTVNPDIPTGRVELRISSFDVLSASEVLPILVQSQEEFPEDLRLRYRYIDLRRRRMQDIIKLRSGVIKAIRDRMWELGFNELQTPILTASSPEGARDFLVPSRQFPGRFYALPQAPQQFKQLAMVAGFDKYFQIAPCFRDEDGRADRMLEFYQLDMEMSFATQEDVFEVARDVFGAVFGKFAGKRRLSGWETISHARAMEDYGSDKPDLRNPLIIKDITEAFRGSGFAIFAGNIAKGAVVKAIRAPRSSGRPRSWFDGLNDWARANRAAGLGYIVFDGAGGEAKGPIAKNLEPARIDMIRELTGSSGGDSVFFVCDKLSGAQKFAGLVRAKLAADLDLVEKDVFRFAFIVDFPLYELDEDTGKLDFAHNPFSMPQGGIKALDTDDLLSIKAHQYDMVCNGYELTSGAVRNTDPECIIRAFMNVGYAREEVEAKFSGLLTAFKYGVPPHAGCAPGIDRIVMLLADEPNLREVTLFPANGRGEDLLMGAPSAVSERQLRELHIKVDAKK
ncbi:MAG: aspartate--tRNA ligase [Rickettsiales bacterium]|jgi:aspartyl-tRNA synthetase|nr:aspartate--tRNA ligase [Rickettsiales bacterium]